MAPIRPCLLFICCLAAALVPAHSQEEQQHIQQQRVQRVEMPRWLQRLVNSDFPRVRATDSDDGSLCGSFRLTCRSVKKCVSLSDRCNGVDNCGDNSDEENCPSVSEDQP